MNALAGVRRAGYDVGMVQARLDEQGGVDLRENMRLGAESHLNGAPRATRRGSRSTLVELQVAMQICNCMHSPRNNAPRADTACEGGQPGACEGGFEIMMESRLHACRRASFSLLLDPDVGEDRQEHAHRAVKASTCAEYEGHDGHGELNAAVVDQVEDGGLRPPFLSCHGSRTKL